jgi:hypothetical protein
MADPRRSAPERRALQRRRSARRFAALIPLRSPALHLSAPPTGRRADPAPCARPSAPPPRRSASTVPGKCQPLRSHGTISGARRYPYTHRPRQTGRSGTAGEVPGDSQTAAPSQEPGVTPLRTTCPRRSASRFAAWAPSHEPGVTPIRTTCGRRAVPAPFARPSAPPPRRSTSNGRPTQLFPGREKAILIAANPARSCQSSPLSSRRGPVGRGERGRG